MTLTEALAARERWDEVLLRWGGPSLLPEHLFLEWTALNKLVARLDIEAEDKWVDEQIQRRGEPRQHGR